MESCDLPHKQRPVGELRPSSTLNNETLHVEWNTSDPHLQHLESSPAERNVLHCIVGVVFCLTRLVSNLFLFSSSDHLSLTPPGFSDLSSLLPSTVHLPPPTLSSFYHSLRFLSFILLPLPHLPPLPFPRCLFFPPPSVRNAVM